MTLKGLKVGILAESLYQDMELWVPLYRLREEGADVRVIGSGTAQRYESKHGYPVKVDADASSVKAADLDGLVIPGGYAPDLLRTHEPVTRLVREMDGQGKLVAAICHAGWVLVSAGIAKGRTMTGYAAIKDDVVNAGAEYVDREVVVDRNLVTSRRPDDIPAFCREIVKFLSASR